MGELFDEDEDDIEHPVDEEEELDHDHDHDDYQVSPSDARRRLESMLAEKKLRDELEDFFDDIEE